MGPKEFIIILIIKIIIIIIIVDKCLVKHVAVHVMEPGAHLCTLCLCKADTPYNTDLHVIVSFNTK